MIRILRFLKALIKYIFYGNKVSFGEYSERILKCNSCKFCNEWKCNICGCYLDKKAKMSTEKCPENKW